MKLFTKILLLMPVFPTASSFAYTGEKTGNGGVVFVCPQRVKLVDFWESEDLRNTMTLGSPTAPLKDLVDEYLKRVEFFDEGRLPSVKEFAYQVLADLQALNLDPDAETKLVRFTDGTLNFSLDSDETNAPSGCMKAQAVTQKQPEIEGEKLLTISRTLWASMDNEMRVFTIFHEAHIRSLLSLRIANALRTRETPTPLTSTRPARLLNQYLGSERFSRTKTICEFRLAVDGFKMIDPSTNTYGGFTLANLDRNSLICDPTTRRLTSALNAYRRFPLNIINTYNPTLAYSLNIKSPLFDSLSNQWISASAASLDFSDNNYNYNSQYYVDESDFIPGSSKRNHIKTDSGTAKPQGDGSIRIDGMTRLQSYTGTGMIFHSGIDRPYGAADLQIYPDGKYQMTFHP